jgi:hypothetical protein
MSFEEMTVAQLKAELKSRGLTVTGRKEELMKRLQESSQGQDDETDKAVESDSKKVAEPSGPSTNAQEKLSTKEQPEIDANSVADDPLAKRVQRFGESVLPESDKLKLREERFGTSDLLNDKSKQDARAARFGLETEKTKEKSEEELKAALVSRAERFNMPAPELEEQRKKARLERFSKPAAAAASEPASLQDLEGLIKKRPN